MCDWLQPLAQNAPRAGTSRAPAGIVQVIRKLISGGQTGVDRAALDWAIAHGIEHGGWCPKGRLAEDGQIDTRYRLQETPTSNYSERTERNVSDSDATLVISISAKLTGGSKATIEFAKQLGKPVLHISRSSTARPAEALRHFIHSHRVQVLNVAGPRASEEPDAGAFAKQILDAL